MTTPLKYKTAMDKNGNRIVCVSRGRHGFTIQTNGNLPLTHSQGVCGATSDEVRAYVKAWGTNRQCEIVL